MNPDFAIIINYLTKNPEKADAEELVKTARNVGVRAISFPDPQKIKASCQKYTIKLLDWVPGQDIEKDELLDALVQNRKALRPTRLNISLDLDGHIANSERQKLELINHWMHFYGHAFNEGGKSELTASSGFILQNRHAKYQAYLFLKTPLPAVVTVKGLQQEPSKVQWIKNRKPQAFSFSHGLLTISLTGLEEEFPWELLRIQEHRPEDDIKKTEY